MYLWSFDDFKPGEGGLNDREAGDLQDSGQMKHESVAMASSLTPNNMLLVLFLSVMLDQIW